MSATTLLHRLLLLFLLPLFSSATLSRRILHQPFFSSSSAPAQPPSISPPFTTPTPVSKYPFSGSPPDDAAFFPTDSSPPPPQPPLPSSSSSSASSFPANISSLVFPHSPSYSHKPLSVKLVAVTVALSLSAAVISAVALLFFCRGNRGNVVDKDEAPANAPPPPPLPQLRKPSNNSSEFLYLGTLVNAAASINGGGGGGARRETIGGRKLQSPELHPLPPLTGGRQRHQQLEQEYRAQDENNNRGSERGNSNVDSTSSDSSTTTNSSGSPTRSASTSISPPRSNSPNPNSKYAPEFVELQVQYPAAASPPLPDMSFSPSSIKDEEEAEESPLLSNASSSTRITSPVERDWGVLGRASPPLSITSTPTRKSSFTLPSFIGGRRNSWQSMSATISPVSLHSPISSNASSPLSNSSSRNKPILSSISAGNTPRLSFSGRFSPRPSNLSDGKSSSAKISPFPPPPRPPPPPPPVAESMTVEKQAAESPIEKTLLRPKLKPLHWDKVRASSDREMVWDQLRASSFKLNEEMIETLFTVNDPNSNQKNVPRKHFQHSQIQENRVLDPKKAQNIAILLRAVNVTMDEVCEALLDGNVDTLGAEMLECLLRMAPTKEEERKLKEYKDDSPLKLGQAEKFLKAVIDIPFAFKRVEAMLYIVNFESEIEYLTKSFETLQAACDELKNSRMFMKLLEAVLKTGNRMNIGTNRGDARAFKLDTLLKLVDIKAADGKTTLLHFVVQEIVRTEGQRFFSSASNQSSNDEAKCRKLGLQLVSNISSELTNVKNAAAMDSNDLSNDVEKLTVGLANIGEMVRLNEQTRFSESMIKFMKMAEKEIKRVQTLESVSLSVVKEITEYFHGNSAKEEAHPFRIFTVVRDFLAIVDRVCKEVSVIISEQTKISSGHRFPVLPTPVNQLLPQLWSGFAGMRQSSFSEDDDGSP